MGTSNMHAQILHWRSYCFRSIHCTSSIYTFIQSQMRTKSDDLHSIYEDKCWCVLDVIMLYNLPQLWCLHPFLKVWYCLEKLWWDNIHVGCFTIFGRIDQKLLNLGWFFFLLKINEIFYEGSIRIFKLSPIWSK
jgi:hypothetical protein